MPLVPYRFLFRIAYPCRYVAEMPLTDDDSLLELPEECRIENFAAMDDEANFADVRLAWNERGVGLQLEVRGKERPAVGDPARPRGSDGVTLWLDTRDARAGHRATRTCHQFHFLASGAGPEHDEAAFVQTKINRALEDAPHARAGAVAFAMRPRRGGYRLEAWLTAAALNGYDPEQHPRLGFFYAVCDDERGEQLLSLSPEFPYWEDPSLWAALELTR